jgi:hypothetical protein
MRQVFLLDKRIEYLLYDLLLYRLWYQIRKF